MPLPSSHPSVPGKGRTLPFCLVLGLATLGAYLPGFEGAFVYDDHAYILANPSIRDPANLKEIFFPGKKNGGLSARPLVNLTLAWTRALGGNRPLAHHAGNFLFHLLSGLLVFGIMRRSLRFPSLTRSFSRDSDRIAFFSALLFLVHPLNTQAVTYLSQRSECQAGALILLCLYLAVRGWQEERPLPWHLGSLAAFGLAAASKETALMAPFAIFLYDRTIRRSGSETPARPSSALYAGLFLIFLGQALFVLFHTGVSLSGSLLPYGPMEYLRSQPEIFFHYLRLFVWPGALCFDYAWPISPPGRALAFAVPVAALALAVAVGLIKRIPAAFPLTWVLLFLLPTSGPIPLQNLAFENRMYLPVAGLAALAACGIYFLAEKKGSPRTGRAVATVFLSLLCLGLAVRTFDRNRDYKTPETLWRDTLAKRPDNPWASQHLGHALLKAGRAREAIQAYERAVSLAPDSASARYSLAKALSLEGRYLEAGEHYEKALALDPYFARAHEDFGAALLAMGKPRRAMRHLTEAVRLSPENPLARNNLGLAHLYLGNDLEAVIHFREALALGPDAADTLGNLGMTLLFSGNREEAVAHLSRAVELDPDFVQARVNLAVALSVSGDRNGARAQIEKALEIDPNHPEARNFLETFAGEEPESP